MKLVVSGYQVRLPHTTFFYLMTHTLLTCVVLWQIKIPFQKSNMGFSW